MAEYTKNLNLEKPDYGEYYDIGTFNANADKIDKGIEDSENRSTQRLDAHKQSNDHTADKIRYDGKIPKDNVKDALDETDTRIDNIVSQGGSDNTEVVDARHSTTKDKTYDTLKGRLEDGEQDIEKLKTDTNVAESVTETSYDSVIPVPDSATNGQVSGVVRGLTATNLVKNGDFSDGTTGWQGANGNITTNNNIATHTINNYFRGAISESGKHKAVIGNKLFVRAKMRVTNSQCQIISLIIQYLKNNVWVGQNLAGLSNPVENQWYNFFAVLELRDEFDYEDYRLEIRHTYEDENTALDKQMEVKEVIMIDLTAHDLDHLTAEEVNTMLPDWFDGTKSTVGSARISSADDTGEVRDRAYVTALKDGKIVNLMSHEGIRDEIDLDKGVLIKRLGVDEEGLIYQLAEPEIIPVRWTGLQAYENGTVYVDTVISELGFYYDNGLESHYPDHPIQSIDTLYRVDKETGYKEPLDVSKCEIREDRLSFTHPDLVDGDLCDWDYVPMTESTRPETSLTFPSNLKASVNSLLDAEKINKKEHNIFKARLDNHDRDIERIDDDIENVQSDIDAHKQDSNNPHSVTPSQIGAETPEGAQAKIDVVANDLESHKAEDVSSDSGVHGIKYEEGIWTPYLLIGGRVADASYRKQNGHYIRINNIVHCQAEVFLDNKGTSTGLIYLAGLPFSIKTPSKHSFDNFDNFNISNNDVRMLSLDLDTKGYTIGALRMKYFNRSTVHLQDTNLTDKTSFSINFTYLI